MEDRESLRLSFLRFLILRFNASYEIKVSSQKEAYLYCMGRVLKSPFPVSVNGGCRQRPREKAFLFSLY